MLVDTFHYTILCRDFPYFLFEKKRKYAKKNFHASRNRPAARWRPKWGRRSSRFAQSLRTFFLRKKESMQRKTLTLRATGWRQDEGRNEGLALRAIAFGRNGSQREGRSLRTFFLRKKKVCKEKLSRFARQAGSKMKSEKREGRSRFAQSLGQDKAGLLVADSGGMGYNGRKKKSPVMAGEREERMMLKPRRLYPGDRVAMVSLS